MSAWAILAVAGLLEVVWAYMLKLADGFDRPGWLVGAYLVAGVSFALLALAMRNLPMGTAYAVWTGIGALGAALLGILALGEAATPLRLAGVGLILAGIAALKLG